MNQGPPYPFTNSCACFLTLSEMKPPPNSLLQLPLSPLHSLPNVGQCFLYNHCTFCFLYVELSSPRPFHFILAHLYHHWHFSSFHPFLIDLHKISVQIYEFTKSFYMHICIYKYRETYAIDIHIYRHIERHMYIWR